MLYVETGVWHNPRIIKQKQYIPKYALTLANLIRNDYKLPDLLFLRIDSSVKICMVRVRERLSADNRLQRYNKNLKYTKEFMFFVVFFAFAHDNYILSVGTALRVQSYSFFVTYNKFLLRLVMSRLGIT